MPSWYRQVASMSRFLITASDYHLQRNTRERMNRRLRFLPGSRCTRTCSASWELARRLTAKRPEVRFEQAKSIRGPPRALVWLGVLSGVSRKFVAVCVKASLCYPAVALKVMRSLDQS